MITHDFSVVSSLCDTVAVMYAGYIVESGDAKKIILSPEHPYTKGLIGSVPKLDLRTQHVPKRLPQIDGFPPDLLNLPGGCSFADRCPEVHPKCLERVPLLVHLEQSHQVRCINREEQSNVSAS